ncbi:MAG: hypothetical protein ACK5NK_15410 [Niabella sp.]
MQKTLVSVVFTALIILFLSPVSNSDNYIQEYYAPAGEAMGVLLAVPL